MGGFRVYVGCSWRERVASGFTRFQAYVLLEVQVEGLGFRA